MELAFIIIVGIIFTILGLVCVVTMLLGLPGSWILIGLAVVVNLCDPLYLSEGADRTFNWWLLGACGLLAAFGEVLEFIAGALGAKHAGSSRRGMIGALIGGVIGAVLGMGIPIPIIGSLIGAVIGTFIGAIAGELSAPQAVTVRESLKPAAGATVGRVLGTLSKLPIAVAIWAVLTIAAFWP